jgi:hypothetical protein
VIYSQNAIFEHAKIDIEATINGTISNVHITQQIYFEWNCLLECSMGKEDD